jgi:signal peptidase I
MEPTIPKGTSGIPVLKCAYSVRVPFTAVPLFRTAAPQRGDIVVVRNPEASNRAPFIKRVVAIAGDTVAMENERLVLNGQPVDVTFSPGRPSGTGEATLIGTTTGGTVRYSIRVVPERKALRNFSTVLVPPGHVFVLGDNRDESRDSRFFGAQPLSEVIGRVLSVPVRK